MKTKIITFIIMFPLFQILGFIITCLTQVLYVVRKKEVTTPFAELFIEYILHPILTVQECINLKNPFVFIMPVLMMILLIYLLTLKARITSQIDGSGIYGSANWESIGNLTRRNVIGKRKFTRYSKKKFLEYFLESIDENTKTR